MKAAARKARPSPTHPPPSPLSPRIARLPALPQRRRCGGAVNLPSPQPAALQEPSCRHREASEAAGAGSVLPLLHTLLWSRPCSLLVPGAVLPCWRSRCRGSSSAA